ncbi:MAG: 50S ribosomal protein L9 [Kiritimatiellaeota bacterium]|nr:50S ribosomal protein L9 [Kiritimatiellota bacterium]
MPIEVLVMKDLPDLGEAGTVTRVADGYARNYLFPKKLAAPVTEASRRKFEKIRKEIEAERAQRFATAKKKAASLRDASVTIRMKTTDGDALFGSVTAADIAKAVTADLAIDLDRTMVLLEEPIKTLGTYDVDVKIHAEVTATVKVWVVQE